MCRVAGWRLFDDSDVSPCVESNVMTRYAYVLFYQRRHTLDTPPHPPSLKSATTPSATLTLTTPSHVLPPAMTSQAPVSQIPLPTSIIPPITSQIPPPTSLNTPLTSQIPPSTSSGTPPASWDTPPTSAVSRGEGGDNEDIDLDDIKISSSLNDDLETDIDLMD